MPGSDGKPEVMCPVCQTHTKQDALMSQGMVLSGAKAYMTADRELSADVFDSMSKYDGHTAVTMFALAVIDLCDVIGIDPLQVLEQYQKQINAEIAAAV
jgi:hypothetical protein